MLEMIVLAVMFFVGGFFGFLNLKMSLIVTALSIVVAVLFFLFSKSIKDLMRKLVLLAIFAVNVGMWFKPFM